MVVIATLPLYMLCYTCAIKHFHKKGKVKSSLVFWHFKFIDINKYNTRKKTKTKQEKQISWTYFISIYFQFNCFDKCGDSFLQFDNDAKNSLKKRHTK